MYLDKKKALLEYWIYSNFILMVSVFFLLFVIVNASKYVIEVVKTKLYLLIQFYSTSYIYVTVFFQTYLFSDFLQIPLIVAWLLKDEWLYIDWVMWCYIHAIMWLNNGLWFIGNSSEGFSSLTFEPCCFTSSSP